MVPGVEVDLVTEGNWSAAIFDGLALDRECSALAPVWIRRCKEECKT